MAGYGGQEIVPSNETTELMEQCHPASPLFPSAFSSEAPPSPDSHRRGLGPIRELEERCTLLQEDPSTPDDLVSLLTERLKSAQERESALSNSLNSITRSLWYEMHNGKEREAELLQERSEFEAQIMDWKRLYSMALASYQENEEEIRIMQMAQEKVDGAVNAQLEELQTELVIKQTELDEKDFIIAEKDRTVLASEEDKQAFREEMVYVINGSITILQNISEQVLELTVGLQKFQLRNGNGETSSTIPRAPSPSQELPTTLLSCAEEVSNRIIFARSALDEAFKQWKEAEAGLEIMQSYNRKCLLAKVLGKEEPAASDAGKETTAGLNQVD